MPALGYNRLFKRIIFSYKRQISALIILSILGIVFSLITPLIIRNLIDEVFIGRKIQLLLPILSSVSVIFIISSLANYFSARVKGNLDILIYRELAGNLFSAVTWASLDEVQRFKTGDLQARTLGNVTIAVQTITAIIPGMILAFLGIILPFLIMASLAPSLAVIAISPVVLFFLSSWYFGEKIKNGQKPVSEANATLFSFLKESYTIIPLIKVFALESLVSEKFDFKLDQYCRANQDIVGITSLNASVNMIIFGIPTILVLFFGGANVINNTMSLGTFTAFMAYTALFFAPVQQISSLWATYKISYSSHERINDILLLNPETSGEKSLPPNVTKIEFRSVKFSYGDRSILDTFNARFLQGCNYLLGDNGSGKTTIVKLLCGLISPVDGKILFNNENISEIRKDVLRSSISVVFSDPFVFDGSILENLSIGNPDATEEEVIEAARKAELHEFIEKLPYQYETQVGESGLTLSSGEKQKIALARVILRDSPIIIFDECTRSIDIESKKSILSIIRKMNGKILIIITHNADEIDPHCNRVFVNRI